MLSACMLTPRPSPSCSGVCAVVAATSGSRPRSSTASTRSDPWCWAGRSSGRSPTPPRCFGARGGGGATFGTAPALESRLPPVGPMVLGGPIFWPLADAPEVLRFVADFALDAPDELGIMMTTRLAPPAPFLPPEQYG